MTAGACTDGIKWIDASSRECKEDIKTLSMEEALEAMLQLNLIKYIYKADRTDWGVGFIAEEVPDLMATKDRKGLSAMDIVAVLTKIIQDQEKTIRELSGEVNDLKKELRLREW
jgi:hypothetical protein